MKIKSFVSNTEREAEGTDHEEGRADTAAKVSVFLRESVSLSYFSSWTIHGTVLRHMPNILCSV